jgi:hypothetical protein
MAMRPLPQKRNKINQRQSSMASVALVTLVWYGEVH